MTTEANIELPLEDVGYVDEAELLTALRRRYPPSAYALLSQVSNATGGRRTRIADALAMGLWPSRGLELHGFEMKRERNDWLGELKNPAKADAFIKFCHRWWVVAGSDDIVRGGELPPTWGLLVLGSRGLVCAAEAPLLTPEPMTLEFVAAILRRIHDSYVPKKDITRLLRIEREDATEFARKTTGSAFEWLKEKVEAFEKASGVDIRQYGHEADEIGWAVSLILENRNLIGRAHFANLRTQARASLETLDAIAAAITPKEETK